MPYNAPLMLRVANKKDFVVPIRILFLLGLFSAVLSPQPVLLTLLAILFFGAGWAVHTLGLYKVNTVELTVVIFPDGGLSLKSGREDSIASFLDGQQWCTHRFAVLRIAKQGTARKLVILSSQQQSVDDFRRLNMWLRQGVCADTGKKQLSGI